MPNDIVTKLRDLADEVEKQCLAEIRPDMSITEAWNALSGFKEATLEVSIKRRTYDKDTKIEFQIYDGSQHFKSPSLSDALRKALEAHPATATMEKIGEMFGEKNGDDPQGRQSAKLVAAL